MTHELTPEKISTILASPDYRRLRHERDRLAVILSSIMLAAYVVFILLVAFRPDILALPLFGSAVTLAIPAGVGLLLLAFLLTGIYAWVANRRFDALVDAARRHL